LVQVVPAAFVKPHQAKPMARSRLARCYCATRTNNG
jgi:hypothetical protein